MYFSRKTEFSWPSLIIHSCRLFLPAVFLLLQLQAQAADAPEVQAEELLKAGQTLVVKKHYLEALDLLEEARDLLDTSGMKHSGTYSDVLFDLAQTKIKGRLYQGFPAYYVKSALEDVQAANKLMERLAEVLPQKLAEGYYLEGYIQKKFFMRNDIAVKSFLKAVNIDPGSIAAKRELSELIAEDKNK